MKNEIDKLCEIYNNAHSLQKHIIEKFLEKTTNNTIRQYLNEMLDSQINILNMTELLYSIEERQLHMLDIGTTVPDDFNKEFRYCYFDDYGDIVMSKLIFRVNNNIIDGMRIFNRIWWLTW